MNKYRNSSKMIYITILLNKIKIETKNLLIECIIHNCIIYNIILIDI